MFFGLLSTQKAKLINPNEESAQRPDREHERTKNALLNFIKFEQGKDLLKRQDELRAGSLSYLANRSVAHIKEALDSLERIGVLQGKTKIEVLENLEKLFELRDFKTAYGQKTNLEIERTHDNFRSILKELSEPQANKVIPKFGLAQNKAKAQTSLQALSA
jgi:hypothetical protein